MREGISCGYWHVECLCLHVVRCADEAETLAWLNGGWNAERTAKWVSLQMGSRKNTPLEKRNPPLETSFEK